MMTRLARRMVCEWGMSEKLGMVEYGEHEDYVFLGREMHKNRDYSEATAQEIDREVRKFVDDGYTRAKELILANREKLEVIANALLEFETLDGEQIRDIIETGTDEKSASAAAAQDPAASSAQGASGRHDDRTGNPSGIDGRSSA